MGWVGGKYKLLLMIGMMVVGGGVGVGSTMPLHELRAGGNCRGCGCVVVGATARGRCGAVRRWAWRC